MLVKNKKAGTTMVELIVVLVVIATLAAMLVPTMLGWIKDARDQQVLLYANNAFKAAQSSLVESYATDFYFYNGATRQTITFTNNTKKLCGYLGPFTFGKIQKNEPITGQSNENGRISQVKMAKAILTYLAGTGDKFTFQKTSDNLSGYASFDGTAQGCQISQLTGSKTIIFVVWDSKGKIIYFSFGYHQCLVLYDTVNGDGSFKIYKGEDTAVNYGVSKSVTERF